jgi:hypothetical protein
MSSRRRRSFAPLLALAAAGTVCTPFKPDAECSHRQPPPRPNVAHSGASLPDIVLAISAVTPANTGPGWYKDVGFDLDNMCTGEGQGPSCVEPPWATADHTDGVDGIDNSWGQAWKGTGTIDATTPVMLFRISSYSGQPDDDQVEVSLYAGFELAPRSGAADGGTTLVWDGHDRWEIMQEMLVPSTPPSVNEPLYRDDKAYVAGGMLVAHFSKALWSPLLAFAPYQLLPATQVVLAGALTNLSGLWQLQDATVDMRIRFNDLLASLAHWRDNVAPGEVACENVIEYQTVRDTVCPLVDIASIPGASSAPCDAISTAVPFEAKQAQLGDVRLPSPKPRSCLKGIDPATDTCVPVN